MLAFTDHSLPFRLQNPCLGLPLWDSGVHHCTYAQEPLLHEGASSPSCRRACRRAPCPFSFTRGCFQEQAVPHTSPRTRHTCNTSRAPPQLRRRVEPACATWTRRQFLQINNLSGVTLRSTNFPGTHHWPLRAICPQASPATPRPPPPPSLRMQPHCSLQRPPLLGAGSCNVVKHHYKCPPELGGSVVVGVVGAISPLL